MTHDVAVIMVTYNKLFDSALQSVRTMIDTLPHKVQLIVVDNGSTQIDAHTQVKKVVPEAQVILRDGNHGMGRSCNLAVKDTDAEFLFFLNPDTHVPDPTIVSGLRDFLCQHPQVGIVAPRLTYPSGEAQTTCFRFHRWYTPIAERTKLMRRRGRERHHHYFHMNEYNRQHRRMVDWVQGSAMMMRKDLFDEIGGFDDRYRLYLEDMDLCRESWNRGRPVYYLPEFVMTHAYGKASNSDAGILRGLVNNPAMRYHIHSWLKYQWKWRGNHVV